jgi:hypothetical protein
MYQEITNVLHFLKDPNGSHLVTIKHNAAFGSSLYLVKITNQDAAMLLLRGHKTYHSVRHFLNCAHIPHSVVKLSRMKL